MIMRTEPDSLANLVTNLDVAECAAAESAYLECVNYALVQLNLPNVAMYIDAGRFLSSFPSITAFIEAHPFMFTY